MKPGEKNKITPGSSSRIKLLEVCRLLNRRRAKYLVIGGWACNLHGLIRGTKDVDLLIPRDVPNTEKILSALGNLAWGVARKPFTIIGDLPRVDLETLIRTKRTDRLQDKADVERLRQFFKNK
jgi:hypothetical protein